MRSVFLTAHWRYLVMLNYEIDPSVLKPIVPTGTELDAWNGKYYVSVVGFRFLNTRVLGIPIPFHRNFEEINLRFYVRRKVQSEWRRGVVFIKEIVPRRAIAVVARWVYNENYVSHRMNSKIVLPDESKGEPGIIEYGWIYGSRINIIQAQFGSVEGYPKTDSEEAFITEHYWGYVTQRDGSTIEYQVEHPRWRVWHVFEAKFDSDISSFYGSRYSEALSQKPSSAFVADGSPVSVLQGVRIVRKKE